VRHPCAKRLLLLMTRFDLQRGELELTLAQLLDEHESMRRLGLHNPEVTRMLKHTEVALRQVALYLGLDVE